MAQSEEKGDHEFAGKQETEGKEEDNEKSSNSELPNTPLPELNILLVLLSAASSSEDDCLESEEREQNVKNQAEAKACISRFQTKRRDINKPKIVRRPRERFHTAIRDCRHGRKM